MFGSQGGDDVPIESVKKSKSIFHFFIMDVIKEYYQYICMTSSHKPS